MRQSSTRRVFHYYWLSVKKHRGWFFVAFGVYGIAAIISGAAIPLLYREIIDHVSLGLDRAEMAPQLLRLIFLLAGVSFVANLLYRFADFSYTVALANILRSIANDAFDRIQRHSYQFFSDEFAGALVAKARRFIDRFQLLSDQVLFHFWMNGIQLAIILITLSFLSKYLGLFFLVWCVIFVASTVTVVKYKKRLDAAEAAEDSHVTARLADVITNVLNVKMFSSAAREQNDFEQITTRQFNARSRAWQFENIMIGVQGTLVAILEVAGMYVAVKLWLASSISTGTIVLVQVYYGRVFGVLWNLGHNISRFGRALAEAIEMTNIFDKPLSITDPSRPEPARISEGEIVFDDVTFRYGSKSDSVFSSFNLRIAPNERIGLVGPSGAGKSTITKLLLRFVDVEKGAIRLDGQDIRNITQNDLRAHISYVPQDPILFHRSLAENIRYGKPDASDEEVVKAARSAHAHDFIDSLPQKYETLVGERGIKLSGGERQRIAIARAMLKDAPILILDEATSSLDSESEKYIQAAFLELMKGRTTIVIAHRLSTIQHMDRIIVLAKGQIAEDGTHAELLERKGIYHTLWSHQAGGFIS